MSCSWLFKHIITADVNGWTPIQYVSPSLWAGHNTQENGLTPIQDVSPHQFLSRSESLKRICWKPIQVVSSSSSVWESQNHWQEWLNVLLGSESALQCLSISKSLWWITEHTSSVWVAALHCFGKSDPTDKMTEHASSKWVSLQCCSNLNHSS